MSYEINVYQYLIYEKDKEREGLSQITITSSDGSKLKIGYGWPSYYNDGSKKSIALIKSLSERDIAGINSLLCAKTLNIPDVNQQIQAGLNFFEGKATDGKSVDDKGRVYVDGRHSYHFYVSDSEFVEGGVPSLTYISVDIKNIETDAGKIYCIKFYSYLLNKNDKNAEGISQIIIADENGKEVSIGNKIDWLSVP